MAYGLLKTPAAAYRRLRATLALRSVDALLASYPKSGRTWFRFILANYLVMLVGADYAVDLHSMFSVLPNLAWDGERGIPGFDGRSFIPPIPMIAVTHEQPRALLPKDCPIVFMERDPRDVMVSAYFHATRHKHRYAGDIDAFVRDPAQGLPALVRYMRDWQSILPAHPHRIVHYERLSEAPETETAEVLRLLGIPVNDAYVRRAVDAARFSEMRRLEVEQGIPGHAYDRADPQALRTRRGKVGGYREELTSATADWIFETYRSALDIKRNSVKA